MSPQHSTAIWQIPISMHAIWIGLQSVYITVYKCNKGVHDTRLCYMMEVTSKHGLGFDNNKCAVKISLSSLKIYVKLTVPSDPENVTTVDMACLPICESTPRVSWENNITGAIHCHPFYAYCSTAQVAAA